MSSNLEFSSNHSILEEPQLNPMGQATLGGLASLSINAFVHPICTVKNRQMANGLSLLAQRMSLKSLYNGYGAICGVDAAAFTVQFIVNAQLQHTSPLFSSIAAGIACAPIIAFGEGLMANRQVHALPYSQILRRAIRVNGLITTMLREIPFTVGVFYCTPLLEEQIRKKAVFHHSPESGTIGLKMTAGLIGGALVGIVTTPADLIKTRIQTSENNASILHAFKAIYTKAGLRGFFSGCTMRTFYLAMAGLGMHMINHTTPYYLPKALHAEKA